MLYYFTLKLPMCQLSARFITTGNFDQAENLEQGYHNQQQSVATDQESLTIFKQPQSLNTTVKIKAAISWPESWLRVAMSSIHSEGDRVLVEGVKRPSKTGSCSVVNRCDCC